MSAEAAAPKNESSPAGSRPVGRPPLLNEQDLQVLMELTLAEPHATIRRLQQRMEEQCGKRPSRRTVRDALKLLGVSKEQPRRQPSSRRSQRPLSPPRAARYRARHRREPSRNPRRYPSDLTDPEWALVEPLVARPGQRGRPHIHSRRRILDAIFYVLRSGCQWRMLPLDYPPWQTVYSCFRRWKERGLLKKLHEPLRATYRQREGREVQPSGGIVDSQSVKTTEKGGPQGTTRARRSRVANAISSSIPWG
jgi:putative transposase